MGHNGTRHGIAILTYCWLYGLNNQYLNLQGRIGTKEKQSGPGKCIRINVMSTQNLVRVANYTGSVNQIWLKGLKPNFVPGVVLTLLATKRTNTQSWRHVSVL